MSDNPYSRWLPSRTRPPLVIPDELDETVYMIIKAQGPYDRDLCAKDLRKTADRADRMTQLVLLAPEYVRYIADLLVKVKP